MGFNSTLFICNDGLHEIEQNPHEFVQKLVQAIQKASPGNTNQINIAVGNFSNVATLVESHHSSSCALIAAGGNHATVLDQMAGQRHDRPSDQIEILKRFAEALGYQVSKKPERKNTTNKEGPIEL